MNRKEKCMVIIGLVVAVLNFSATGYLVYSEIKTHTAGEDQQYDLYKMSYFVENSLNGLSMYQLFNLPDSEYMLYFYANDCLSCEISEEYVAAYIDYGFTDKVPIYFINVEDNGHLLALEETGSLDPEEFKVVYTPTLLLIKGDSIEYYTGSNSVYEVLDKIVRR